MKNANCSVSQAIHHSITVEGAALRDTANDQNHYALFKGIPSFYSTSYTIPIGAAVYGTATDPIYLSPAHTNSPSFLFKATPDLVRARGEKIITQEKTIRHNVDCFIPFPLFLLRT